MGFEEFDFSGNQTEEAILMYGRGFIALPNVQPLWQRFQAAQPHLAAMAALEAGGAAAAGKGKGKPAAPAAEPEPVRRGMRSLPVDMDGFRHYMERQPEASQMQFELYSAVTEGSAEDHARWWITAVQFGQGGIDLDGLAAAITSVNNRYPTHQEMLAAAAVAYQAQAGNRPCIFVDVHSNTD
jgi:hypothetical protein